MFSLLESKEEIATAQQQLEATIKRDFRRRAVKKIGYPGGTQHNAEVATDGRYWFWSADLPDSETPNPRRLNWFGLFEDVGSLQISVEINTGYEGRNDQVAGFFARDGESGAVYLFHSGRVGGGTKGVGKSRFLTYSNEPLRDVVDRSGSIREGVLVMPVEGAAATRSAVRYIDIIAAFKRAVRSGELETPAFRRALQVLDDFYAEARGRRRGLRSSKIDYLSRHGEVVDALHDWRRLDLLPKGARLVKNRLIDMGVALDSTLVEVFEVKTCAARSDVYAAIGQLLVHGTDANCRRVMVLPKGEPLASDLAEALQRLKIEVVNFKLGKEAATICESATA